LVGRSSDRFLWIAGEAQRAAVGTNACFHEVPNTSDNEYFGDVVRAALSRRGLLEGSAGVVVAVGAAGVLAACGDDKVGLAAGGSLVDGVPVGTNFKPVAANSDDALVIPEGYERGDPAVRPYRNSGVTVCVQHPGERDDATAEKPASHWPDGGDSLPRPAVVSVWKKGGGRIGT
jgi:secreted PhoX family phosphatase